MKKVISYDLIGSYKQGIKTHPEADVKSLGMEVYKFIGAPIGDCVFMLVSGIPHKLPKYIGLSGYKF